MMHLRETEIEVSRQLQKPAVQAIVFFFLSVLLLSTALGLGWLLIESDLLQSRWPALSYVCCFAVSTGLLAVTSTLLVRASVFVRQERQLPFRHSLHWALLSGGLFVAVQTYGLWSLVRQDSSEIGASLQLGAFCLILLHAVHVAVALLFLVLVLLRASSDRYDHEYSWGVTFCGWFWHGLGVVWLAIMAAFTIAGAVVIPH